MKVYKIYINMRRRYGSIPPKRTYSEIMEDLNNESDEFKKTPLYKRLVMRAEMLREEEEKKNER